MNPEDVTKKELKEKINDYVTIGEEKRDLKRISMNDSDIYGGYYDK